MTADSAVPDTWDVAIPTDDRSITRRRRALAPTQVLGDLERTKATLDGDFWDSYDLFNIALAVIDQVALSMGISAGRTWDDALRYAASEAARQHPDGGEAQWVRVAERVLVSLVTTDTEEVPYLTMGPNGPVWKAQRFRLLFIHASGADGAEHLRASEAAINVFVNALDLDIEAAQIANEAQMRVLIERGAVESATQIAHLAQHQSALYLEQTRRIVADTLLDPDTHDWVTAVPVMLDAALAHVGDRLRAESEITSALSAQRGGADSAEKLERTNELIERLRDCRRRHNELHHHLLGARSRHRDAVNGRLARPPAATHRVDIGAELFTPLFERPTGAAGDAAERIVAAVGGIRPRWLPPLDTATDDLCEPGREPGLGEEYEQPDFADDELDDWWEPYEATVDAVLESLTAPTRLSHVIARLTDMAGDIEDADGDPLDPDVLTAVGVHAAHRCWAPQLAGRSNGEHLLVALSDGTPLVDRHVTADDLLLLPAEITHDIDTPTTRPSHTEHDNSDTHPAAHADTTVKRGFFPEEAAS